MGSDPRLYQESLFVAREIRLDIRELELGVQNSSRKIIGSSLLNWQLQEMARKELDCAKKTSCFS
jgi:hypothetical protein